MTSSNYTTFSFAYGQNNGILQFYIKWKSALTGKWGGHYKYMCCFYCKNIQKIIFFCFTIRVH